MSAKHYPLLLSLLFAINGLAQIPTLEYYFDVHDYEVGISTPEEIIGYQIGEWHISHDQLYMYSKLLASQSKKVKWVEYARSYENRPLGVLMISSEENLKNIDAIKQKRMDHIAGANVDLSDLPSVIYQGYSVHGNESSGANAAVLMAYHLAASNDQKIQSILDDVIILIDPCLNPDGFNRFANWVNMHKSKNLVSDPADREYNENWPRGRTNHYWFDLNRDWLLVQHPESQGRIKLFHEWYPNILTDHHEMGKNATFFFQPGVPSRTNPLTPQENQDLTKKIATFHATALDKIGTSYYSEESYDDFYYGKGSTYPDANGCIGILFEQASSRGHLQETRNGILSFPFTIRNQIRTSISTLEAGQSMRQELLNYQKRFYQDALSLAKVHPAKGYVFQTKENDPGRMGSFIKILEQHQIPVYLLNQDQKIKNKNFEKGNACWVPTNHRQFRLINSLFETVTSFNDSIFYDVSTWTLPLAFNLSYAPMERIESNPKLINSQQYLDLQKSTKPSLKKKKNVNYFLLDWSHYLAPKILNQLLEKGLVVKVATKNFTMDTPEGEREFQKGTIQITTNNQPIPPKEIEAFIESLSMETGIEFTALNSGLTKKGIQLGSPSFVKIDQPKVAIIVGDGVNAYDAGEAWHLLDQRYGMKATILDHHQLENADLDRYNNIIMVDGKYQSVNSDIDQIKSWLIAGGNLITFKGGTQWASGMSLTKINFKRVKKQKRKAKRRNYSHCDNDSGSHVIGGAILEAKLDLSHPLAFGYRDTSLPIFRKGSTIMEITKNIYATPVVYTKEPLLSGYLSTPNINALSNSAAVIVAGYGSGRVISFADNPNFRAFWYGTNKLFANAIFFGKIIKSKAVE